MRFLLLPLLSGLILTRSGSSAVKLRQVASGFSQPIAILDDPLVGGTRRFVVEQGGKVKIINGTRVGTFLDLTSVVSKGVSEGGLLGIAFHPNYSTNRYLFVDYTISNSSGLFSVIRRLRVSATNPNFVPVGNNARETVLSFKQPFSNHNGGQILFNPIDKYLYIASGDGGSGGDTQNNAQNLAVLLGKILRIDPWTGNSPNQAGYNIPVDNPYVSNTNGFRKEIWHYGLRNPWRFTFDKSTGDMYIGDVGQDAYEEIDFAAFNRSGLNFGWRRKEGNVCFNPTTNCLNGGAIVVEDPISVYSHSVGSSVTGGYLYRGRDIPTLTGKYVFGDFIKGKIFALTNGTGGWSSSSLYNSTVLISSFGERKDGALWVVDYGNGKIFRLVK